jgi:predicted DNA-binding protein
MAHTKDESEKKMQYVRLEPELKDRLNSVVYVLKSKNKKFTIQEALNQAVEDWVNKHSKS